MSDLSVWHCPVGIVGGGSIGVSFALVFARAGVPVRIFDSDPVRRACIPAEISAKCIDLKEFGLLDEPGDIVLARVTVVDSLYATADQVQLVIECAPEKLEIKQALFTMLDQIASPDTVLVSTSSAIPSSLSAGHVPGRQRCLVAHPGNPPHLIPVVEIVPAPFTDADVVKRTCSLFVSAGQQPVVLHREVEGFLFNRLQGAVLREAYCLVRDGVASVEDIDRVMRDGLGLRWSVIGPFETVDLNTRGGIAAHAEKMGPAYARMGAERGQNDPWTPDLVDNVAEQRRAALPLAQWEERVQWRDRSIMALLRHRRHQTV